MALAIGLKFEEAGYTVKKAFHGGEAIPLLEKGGVDLVLLDLLMPKKDGFDVLEAMKKRGDKTPVFVLSNLSQAEDKEHARTLGAIKFFVKANTSLASLAEEAKKLFASQ